MSQQHQQPSKEIENARSRRLEMLDGCMNGKLFIMARISLVICAKHLNFMQIDIQFHISGVVFVLLQSLVLLPCVKNPHGSEWFASNLNQNAQYFKNTIKVVWAKNLQ